MSQELEASALACHIGYPQLSKSVIKYITALFFIQIQSKLIFPSEINVHNILYKQ